MPPPPFMPFQLIFTCHGKVKKLAAKYLSDTAIHINVGDTEVATRMCGQGIWKGQPNLMIDTL